VGRLSHREGRRRTKGEDEPSIRLPVEIVQGRAVGVALSRAVDSFLHCRCESMPLAGTSVQLTGKRPGK
jgi:hypothetical protein